MVKRIMALILAFRMCLSLASCSAQEKDRGPDPEKVMENFVRKLEEGNYVIEGSDFTRITVASPGEVLIEYDDESYEDIALFTLDGETFQGTLTEDGVTDVEFVSTDSALKVAGGRLPNSWMDISEGNMFNLFYNNTEDPLEFMSYEDSVKNTLMGLVGYGYTALELMHEVHVKVDREDPATAHITAVVDDNEVARYYYDDIDLTIDFGAAQSDERVGKWLADPVYPEARKSWTDDDLFYLNSVFFPGYALKAVPFPEFSSYAMTFDKQVFSDSEKIRLTDSHATEQDVKDYIELLKREGFEEVTDELEDGTSGVFYRRLLREETGCYASLRPYYDNGFVLEADRHFDMPRYDSLEEINEVLANNGFPALDETDIFTDLTAADTAADRTESWLFFFQYDLSLIVKAKYADKDKLAGYLDGYGRKLEESGYKPAYINAGQDLDSYVSPSGASSFRCDPDGDDGIVMQFKNEKVITPEDAGRMIADAGIPAPKFDGDIMFRDISRYHYFTRHFTGKIYLTAGMTFSSESEADRFLNEYTAQLEKAGFDRTNPEIIGSLKQNAYYNEAKDKFVAFDVFPEEEGVGVNFDFVSNS